MGLAGENVFLANDVLEGPVEVPDGMCAVIGGGLVGLEVADYLATAGHPVTVVEMLDEAGADLGSARKICVLGKMARLGVDIRTKTKFVSLADDGIVVEHDGVQEIIPAAAVIVAVGSRSVDNTELKAACEAAGVPVQVIGDAVEPRRALNATREGFLVAKNL